MDTNCGSKVVFRGRGVNGVYGVPGVNCPDAKVRVGNGVLGMRGECGTESAPGNIV